MVSNGKHTRWLPDFGRRDTHRERAEPLYTWGQRLWVGHRGEWVDGKVEGIALADVHDCPDCHCAGTWWYLLRTADGAAFYKAEDAFSPDYKEPLREVTT